MNVNVDLVFDIAFGEAKEGSKDGEDLPATPNLPPALARQATRSMALEQRSARKSVANDEISAKSENTNANKSMVGRAKTMATSLTRSATSFLGAVPPPTPPVNPARPRLCIQGTRWFTPTIGSLEVVDCHVAASASLWWNPFKGHLVIAFNKSLPSVVKWDIELGVGGYDVGLPDWLEDHTLNGLTNVILASLSRTNPLFIDLNAVDEAAEQEQAAAKLQAMHRARKAKLPSAPSGGASGLRRKSVKLPPTRRGATKLDELESLARELKEHEMAIEDHNRQAKYARERMERLMHQLRKQHGS